MKILLPFVSIFFPLWLSAAEHPELKAFPQTVDGNPRQVIVLPVLDNEQDHQVELVVGKVMETDGVNQVRMGGSLEAVNLDGWGYTYYLAKPGPVLSTKMGVPPGQPPVDQFVSMQGKLIRYNSRLPVVVYLPEGYEVRYRIWSAGEWKPR